MKKITTIIPVLLALVFYTMNANAQDQSITKSFDLGNQYYANAKYEEAVEAYQSVLDKEFTSAELHYNLANAYHKLNQLPESIYHYEKALQLNPTDEDIKNNLAYVKKATLDVIDNVPRIGISRVINQLGDFLSVDGWAWLAVIGSLLGVVGFILYYQAIYEGRKRLYFILTGIFFVVAISAMVFAYRTQELKSNQQFAIIFAEEVEVQNEPNRRGDQLFLLHEGTKVKVLENFDNWIQIELADGRKGWLLADTLQII